MIWEVCIQYPNGKQQALHRYGKRESALRCIDRLYNQHGYSLHTAFVVRQAIEQPVSTFAKANLVSADSLE